MYLTAPLMMNSRRQQEVCSSTPRTSTHLEANALSAGLPPSSKHDLSSVQTLLNAVLILVLQGIRAVRAPLDAGGGALGVHMDAPLVQIFGHHLAALLIKAA